MKTIDLILKEAKYTHDQLYDCVKNGLCNGAGGEGGIKWTDEARKLPYFQSIKEQKLLDDLDLISNIHDLDFITGTKLKHFIKSNYRLAIRTLQLLHWTSTLKRITVFVLVFGGTTLFGGKYFNFK